MIWLAYNSHHKATRVMDDDCYIEKHGVETGTRSTHEFSKPSQNSHVDVLQEGAGYDPPTGVEEGEEDEFEHEMEVYTWGFSRLGEDFGIWVCLKIGYIPNYSHLIGIMIINHWV